MLDIGKLRYRLILLDENGVQYDLKDVGQDLGYEENENELASRITFRLADVDGALELCRNGRMVFLLAGFDGNDEEICRGTLKTWRHTYGLTARTADCTVYDTLYQLDKSQDNRYISSGRTTAQVFAEIAADWGIEMEYHGPDVSHGAMPMKNKTPAKMFLELLDDARKKGAGEYILRAVQGKIVVSPVLSNETVYLFGRDNTVRVTYQENISDLVTRVKVLGQSKKDNAAPVEAVLDGRTEFGILQKIYQRNSDETIEAARQAAAELLKEEGEPKEEITLDLPDVPYVRKGDAIYCDRLEKADGYYRVLSVSHDCGARTMTLKVKKAEQIQALQEGNQQAGAYGAGSEVTFLGGIHYVSSNAGAKGYAVKGKGRAKITKTAEGKAHPYHLIHCDRSSNVYGWVDAGTFG